MRKLIKFPLYFFALLIVSFGTWHLLSAQSLTKAQDINANFSGDFLAISDADMIATAYANGILNQVAGIEDSLFHIAVENGKPVINSRVKATNSVISWPAILEWHPQYPYGYVAETRGLYNGSENQMKNVFYDFPKGQLISVIDYENPQQPKVIQQQIVGENLQNVTINQAGSLLAAGTTERTREIMIATLDSGLIQQTYYFSESEINEEDPQDGGIRTIEFHPQKDIVAVNLNGKSVAFYQIKRRSDQLDLIKIGKSVSVGKKLSVGNWHPSGKFFIVSDVAWGSGNLGAILNGKGTLNSVAFAENGKHQLVSSVKVGLSPEGFDISPDGNYAVAVNMRRTYGPKQFWFVPARTKSSLSLVKIDAQTGRLTVVGKEHAFKGALPEDAIFDKESNSVAVAIYHEQDVDYPEQGWIDFWEIQNDQLVKTTTQLKVTRGVHNLLLIP